MSSVQTSRLSSPLAAPAGTRGSARAGDGLSAGATGFDAVVDGYTARPKSTQTKREPAPTARTLGAETHGTTRLFDEVATAGLRLKRTRADALRRHATPPTTADEPAAAAAVDPAHLGAVGIPSAPVADALAAPLVVAPVLSSSAQPAPLVVAPVLSSSAQPAAAPALPAAPALAPGTDNADPTAAVSAVSAADTGAVLGQTGPEANTAGPVSLGQPLVGATAKSSARAQQGVSAASVAGAPTATVPQMTTGASSARVDVVPGPAVSVAPAAPAAASGARVLAPGTGQTGNETNKGVPASPGQPVVATSASLTQPQQAADVTGAAGAPTATDQQIKAGASSARVGVVPDPSTPVPSASTSTASGAPALAQGTGGAPASAAVATGDDTGAVPDQTGPDATSSVAPMQGEPVVVAPAADDQTLQPVAEATSASVTGAPTTPGLGVVPLLTGPVSPASPWTAPAAPATGAPTPFSLPTAVSQQVFTAVSPLLRGADGSYGLELRLHPRDLGAVQVNVDMRNGQISIQMHATDAAARDALRGGMSDLRQQLEDQGLRAGSMEVGSGGANASQPETSWARSEGIDEPTRNLLLPDPPVATAVAASNTSLDLRM